MATPSDPPPDRPEFSRPVALSRLAANRSHDFEETATAAECAALARLYDAQSVRKLRFAGRLTPLPGGGWMLTGTLGATVTQSCVVSFEPVRTRIDVTVRREYLPDGDTRLLDFDPEDDDETERLTDTIDLGLIATEEIALALPAYPHAPGADLPPASGEADEDVRENPFAVLENLRDKIKPPN